MSGDRRLEVYVEAFEVARQGSGELDLRGFLPAEQGPLYLAVLTELVRIDLELGWGANRPRSLDDYRRDFPELFIDPGCLDQVAFEEFRLRRRAGQSPSPGEYARRYGARTDAWPNDDRTDTALPEPSIQIGAGSGPYLPFRSDAPDDDSIRIATRVGGRPVASGPALASTDPDDDARPVVFPEIGCDFLGFILVEELGRGAFGRVYLARQAALADRPVALKLAPDVGAESQALAQLQHTHIVPIHSVHHTGLLQAVCMPYRGHVTLADVLRSRPAAPSTGADLLGTLATKPRPKGAPPAGPAGPAADELARRRYPEAVLWLAGRLAEGLHHAHQRGILHRDIKPANVLLTDEGLPMLLDFNIAEDVKRRDASEALIGGTLPYMAPEQLAAFRDGDVALDGRCDVYSLGIVLFELLTGRFPFPPAQKAGAGEAALVALVEQMRRDRQGPPPCPRAINPAVSPAAAAIVRHCLEADPARRYPSAAALQEDMERQLSHRPLRYAPDRDVRERMRKWARRNPRLGLWLCGAAAVVLLALAVGLGLRARALTRAEEARVARLDFARARDEAQFLLSVRPESAAVRRQGEEACLRALAVYGVLDGRDWRDGGLLRALPPAEREEVEGAVGELLLLLAASRRDRGDGPSAEQALEHNRQAESSFPAEQAPAALWAQRAELCATLGLRAEAEDARKRAAAPIGGPRDRHLRALDLARAGRFREGLAMLEPAIDEAPNRYWPLFLLGLCQEGLGRDTRALAAYTACVALRPDFHAGYVNRGLVALRQKDFPAARADFDRALALAPRRVETHLDRALARQGLGDHEGAIADLTAALDGGIAATRVYFLRARIKAQSGDRAGAQADREEGLKRQPTDELSWVARGVARMHAKPKEALADFAEALKLNPSSRAARMNRAHVFAEMLGQQAPARAELDKVLALYPEHVPALAGQAVVLARLGERGFAHGRIEAALDRDVSGLVRYQAGCVFALTSPKVPADADAAVVHLRRAINAGFGLDLLHRDDDLAALRDVPAFRRLVDGAALLRSASNPAGAK